jgi:hypothetical protein
MAAVKTPPLEQLRLCAEALHGEDWERPMADALRHYHVMSPRPTLDYRIVRKWIVGDRPVPVWVIEVLPRLLARAAIDRPEDAGSLERLATQLSYPSLGSIALQRGL